MKTSRILLSRRVSHFIAWIFLEKNFLYYPSAKRIFRLLSEKLEEDQLVRLLTAVCRGRSDLCFLFF